MLLGSLKTNKGPLLNGAAPLQWYHKQFQRTASLCVRYLSRTSFLVITFRFVFKR